MNSVFDALPGIEVPVASVNSGLAALWSQPSTAAEAAAADDGLAMQVNFLIYFGSRTTAEDAGKQFQTIQLFSHRYPSRVVVLCPLPIGATGEMRAKIYGECFLGKSKSDKRCVEFVVFSYQRADREHLENQVFTCLSNDLPIYFWGHSFGESSRLAEYRALLAASRRVIVDSAIAPDDFHSFPWPDPDSMRDLVFARTLPLRQGIGQFLSRYSMDSLCRGLKSVGVFHGAGRAAEARVLLDWAKARLARCAARVPTLDQIVPDSHGFAPLRTYEDMLEGDLCVQFAIEEKPDFKPGEFQMVFHYPADRSFQWRCDVDAGRAQFDADFGTGRTRLPASASLLPPDLALSEAMFFC